MPKHIKVVFSIFVMIVGVAGYFFLNWLGQGAVSYLALFLCLFSVGSFWVFPEVMHKKQDKTKQ